MKVRTRTAEPLLMASFKMEWMRNAEQGVAPASISPLRLSLRSHKIVPLLSVILVMI